jgi:hypothetical protein
MNWYKLAKKKEKKKKNTNVLYHDFIDDSEIGLGVFDNSGDGGGDMGGGGGEASAEDILIQDEVDDRNPSEYDQVQLEKGIRVELEHTDSVDIATKIAMDHLDEDPLYYEKLAEIHSTQEKESEHVNFYYGKDQEGR